MGRVGAKSTKTEPAWWQELHADGEYPYLIHFSELHWFGDTGEIRDAPVSDKSVAEMVEDVRALEQNKITFGEMSETAAGYCHSSSRSLISRTDSSSKRVSFSSIFSSTAATRSMSSWLDSPTR